MTWNGDVRVGIYNRYWSTRGGGERYAGVVAEALARRCQVELIGVEEVDVEEVAEHLGLDLTAVPFRRWHAGSERDLAPLTAEYDLFVNSTYLSRLPSRARASVYLVLFPQPVWPRRLARPLERVLESFRRRVDRAIQPLEGFFEEEPNGLCWSGRHAVLRISPDALAAGPVRLRFAPVTPWSLGEAILDLHSDGLDWRVDGDELVLESRVKHWRPTAVRLELRPYLPIEHGLPDRRELGVCLLSDTVSRPVAAARWLAQRARNAVHQRSPTHLDSYELLISISRFTQSWVAKRWGRSSPILEPPLDTALFEGCRSGPKERVILSVGRFFAGSHNKKHLEMLKVFRSMCDRDQIPKGWEYHLVGNLHREKLADLEYFAELRRLAQGYPVKLLIDQSLSSLLDEYRKASIFWHAAGWGENDARRPEKLEHFGLTTCEAMCAGCIPVVIAKAGQLEIVTPGRSGFHFQSAAQLRDATVRLISGHGEPWVEELRDGAVAEVERFDRHVFEQRLVDLLSENGLLDSTGTG